MLILLEVIFIEIFLYFNHLMLTAASSNNQEDVIGLSNEFVLAVSAGIHRTCATTASHSLLCWGRSYSSQEIYGYNGVQAVSTVYAKPVGGTGAVDAFAAVAVGGAYKSDYTCSHGLCYVSRKAPIPNSCAVSVLGNVICSGGCITCYGYKSGLNNVEGSFTYR